MAEKATETQNTKIMKLLKIILALIFTATAWYQANAQTINGNRVMFTQIDGHETIQIIAPELSIKEAFMELDRIASMANLWYVNKIVVKDGIFYFRYSLSLTPKKTFILTERKTRITKRKIDLNQPQYASR